MWLIRICKSMVPVWRRINWIANSIETYPSIWKNWWSGWESRTLRINNGSKIFFNLILYSNTTYFQSHTLFEYQYWSDILKLMLIPKGWDFHPLQNWYVILIFLCLEPHNVYNDGRSSSSELLSCQGTVRETSAGSISSFRRRPFSSDHYALYFLLLLSNFCLQ
jgi:hypothetical protein